MKSQGATLILRIPSYLHLQLKQQARAKELSLNKHCRALLSNAPPYSPEAESPVSVTLAGNWRGTAELQQLSAKALEIWEGRIEGLALFGSYARGRETANSDIDLLIVLDRSVTLDRDVYSSWPIRKSGGREVSPLFVQIPEDGERIGGLWFEVAMDGIVLYDRDLQLSRFLSRVRELVAGGQARRMMTHGHPYWVHVNRDASDAPAVEPS